VGFQKARTGGGVVGGGVVGGGVVGGGVVGGGVVGIGRLSKPHRTCDEPYRPRDAQRDAQYDSAEWAAEGQRR
jgi:hypothetical protein